MEKVSGVEVEVEVEGFVMMGRRTRREFSRLGKRVGSEKRRRVAVERTCLVVNDGLNGR